MDTLPDFNKTVFAMLEARLKTGPGITMNFGCSRTSLNPKNLEYLAADFLMSYADFWTFRGRFTQGVGSLPRFRRNAGVSSWAID
jgi:hypothetical protein